MRFSVRHLGGLVLAAALAALLYWVWQDGLTMVQRSLRRMPMLRAIWAEFSPLIMLAFTCLILTLMQVLWDKLPGKHDPNS